MSILRKSSDKISEKEEWFQADSPQKYQRKIPTQNINTKSNTKKCAENWEMIRLLKMCSNTQLLYYWHQFARLFLSSVLFFLSFIWKTKNAQLKNPTDLLYKNLMKPLLNLFLPETHLQILLRLTPEDFTLSNARWFYSSKGSPSDSKGLKNYLH